MGVIVLERSTNMRTSRSITQNARRLRANMTDAERLLWLHLRTKQMNGARFRRQVPLGHYIVDFACFTPKVVIEIDGGQHNEPDAKRHDAQRDDWLRSEGFTVLRFWNNDIIENIAGCWNAIRASLRANAPNMDALTEHSADTLRDSLTTYTPPLSP
jgi:very-short-patch-repair endonuclease